MIATISRQPMAILGAVGLLSLARDLIQWQDDLLVWIDAWQAFSRPIVAALFWWIPAISPWTLPDWWVDYVTMGAICGGAYIRVFLSLYFKVTIEEFKILNKSMGKLSGFTIATFVSFLMAILIIVIVGISWPLVSFLVFLSRFGTSENNKMIVAVYYEFLIWTFGAIAVNYVLLALE